MNDHWSPSLRRSIRIHFLGLILGVLFYSSTGVTRADTVFVTQYFNGTLQIIDSNGNARTVGGFNQPSGLAVDNSGNVYLANYGSGVINKISNWSNPVPTVSVAVSGLSGPVGLAFDRGGNLYVADNADGTIDKIGTNGNRSVFASVPWQVGYLYDLAFDQAGNLYVSTDGTSGGPAFGAPGYLLEFDANGNEVSHFAVGSAIWVGIAVDESGSLYAADYLGGTILKFASPSQYGLGSPTVFTSGLQYPCDLAFDGSGNLYATAINDLYEINAGGNVTHTSAELGFPYAVAVVVPEPSSWALVVLSAGVLLGCGRRHRRTSKTV